MFLTLGESETSNVAVEVEGLSVGIHGPTLNAHAKVAMEKILGVKAATPGVIGVNVPVISPIVSGKCVRAPNANIPFVVRVPFRTRRGSHLFHIFAGVNFRPGLSSQAKRHKNQKS
jgi:hypothetical protein